MMMTTHEDIFGFVDPGREISRPAMVRMKLLHQIAVRPRNVLARRSLFEAQNFIGLIFRNRAAAAAWSDAARIGAPRVASTVSCLTPAGKPAVQIHL
jgi:hypothetical protein